MRAHRCDDFRRRVADASVASGNHEHAITQVYRRVGKVGSHCSAAVALESQAFDSNRFSSIYPTLHGLLNRLA